MLGHGGGVIHHFGGVQQGLGRYATDIQADPTQRGITLDQDDLLAEIGSAKGRRIPARASTQHQQVAIVGSRRSQR